MLKQFQLPIALCMLLVPALANSSIINIDTSYDLSLGFGIQALDDGTVSIANGDQVYLTVNFINNLALTIADGSDTFAGWLYAGDNNSSFTINNASIEFLGFSSVGGASASYNLGTQNSGLAHLGAILSDFLSAGQSITFSGYNVIYDVQSIDQSPHDYSGVWLPAFGNYAVVEASVPEPGSLILLGIGLLASMSVRPRKITN